jgi:hypothetical protein
MLFLFLRAAFLDFQPLFSIGNQLLILCYLASAHCLLPSSKYALLNDQLCQLTHMFLLEGSTTPAKKWGLAQLSRVLRYAYLPREFG